MRLDVFVEKSIDRHEMQGLQDLFREAGFEAQIAPRYEVMANWGVAPTVGERDPLRVRSSVPPLAPVPHPYIVEVVVDALPWIAAAFAGGAAAKAGSDTWDAFRDGGWKGLALLVRRIGRTFKPVPEAPETRGEDEADWGVVFLSMREGYVILRAPESADVVLEDGVPDVAIRQLGELDWAKLDRGRLLWEEDRERWLWVPELSSPRLEPAPTLPHRQGPRRLRRPRGRDTT